MKKTYAVVGTIILIIIVAIVGYRSYEAYKERAEAENKAKYISQIKEYILEMGEIDELKVVEGMLDKEIYGEELEEYIKDFGVDSIGARIYTDREKYAIIIPNSDFLDNQYYYFKNGKFVAYMKEFCGIGGSITYYYKNGTMLGTEEKLEEEMNAQNAREEKEEILKKAKKVYEKYIKD